MSQSTLTLKRAATPAATTSGTSPQVKPKNSASATRTREKYVFWSDAEWVTVVRALMRLFPALGLPANEAVKKISIRQMHQAVLVMPKHRQRTFAQLSSARAALSRACRNIETDAAQTAGVQPPPLLTLTTPPPRGKMHSIPASLSPPPSTVYRQPDGAETGKPKGHVFFSDAEWYSLAIELAYKNPGLLETLHGVRPIDVANAQRVLPTHRRRPSTSFNNKNIHPHITPAFRKLRAKVSATRTEVIAAKEQAQAAAAINQSEREAEAQQAAQNAAQDAMRADLMASPDFIKQALATVGIGALFDAFAMRLAASAQGMIEAAIINAMSSDRVKNALTVNVYTERPAPAREPSAPATSPTIASPAAKVPHPPIMGEARPPAKPRKIIIGLLGMKSVQAQELQREFPQFEILHMEQVTTKAISELGSAAKIIASRFMTHAPEGPIIKHFGDRYTRLHGGISMIKRQIKIWMAAGVFGAEMQGAQ